MQARLVGRDEEIRVLAEAAARACAGEGAAIVLRGDAGIGKTTLLDHFAASEADAMRALRIRGYESETGLAYAALTALVPPLLATARELAPPQTRALRAALGLESSSGADPFGVATATYALIEASAEERPLLVVIDDAHWLDPASADALLFTARRIEPIRALLVFAARDGEPWPRGLDALPALPVAGLMPPEALQLLDRKPERRVAPDVARELVRRTLGNPLALLELQATLDDATRSGARALDDPIPVGAAVESLFLRSVRALPEPTQHALLRIAADNAAPPPAADALEHAERVGLVRVARGTYEFRHPLVRAAVYHGASDPDRRRVHAELARELPESESARRALHLALAASTPDEEVAAQLEREAGAAMARSGVAEAAKLLELAAELSPDDAHAVRRYAAAAKALLFAGELARATSVADLARRKATDTRSEVLAQQVHAITQLWRGEVMSAHRALVDAGERVADIEPPLAASLYVDAVQPAFTAGEVRRALDAARRAHELATGAGGPLEQQARLLFVSALVLAGAAGRRESAHAQLDELVPPDDVDDALAAGYALALVWLERFPEAARAAADATARARTAAAPTALPILLGAQTEAELWLGNVRAAVTAGSEGATICESLGGHVGWAYVLAVLARAEAVIGLDSEARAHAEQALAMAQPLGLASIEVYAASALALADLLAGHHEEAVRRLAPLRTFYRERGIGELTLVPWHGDLVEAAYAAGQDGVAEATLKEIDEAVRRTGSRWGEGVALRARAGRRTADADEDFENAARLLEHAPLEHARTLLAYGAWLRRVRRRADARRPLREALAAFERTGASSWAERARHELAAAGETTAETTVDGARRLLSAQELRIAFLVADGLTNREIASRLIVSPKTIEYHLANAYRKLGVRSRVELVRRLGDAAPAG